MDDLPQYALYLIAVGVAIAGYYIFVMRRARRAGGGDAYGLAPGEGVAAMFGGRLLIDPSGAVEALLGTNKDQQVTVTFTTSGRVVIASPMGNLAPIAFGPAGRPPAQIVGNVTYSDGRQYQLAGMAGMEPARVLRVAPPGAQPMRLILAHSGGQQMEAWSRG